MLNLFIIIASMLAGMAVSRFFTIPNSTPLRLNQFVIFVTLPAVILLNMPHLDGGSNFWYPMLSCWLVVGASALAVWLIGRSLNWNKDVTGALMLLVPLGNTSYLGFPALKILIGDHAIPYAILYDQLGNFIALAIYGSIIAAWYDEKASRLTAPSVLLRVLRFPPFIALIIALNIDPLPAFVSSPLEILAMTLVPLTMFIVGLQFRLRIDPDVRQAMYAGLGIKMLLAPLLLLATGLLTSQSSLMLHTTVLESAMPPMVTAGVMAIAAGLNARLASSMVGLGVLFAFMSLPLISSLLRLIP